MAVRCGDYGGFWLAQPRWLQRLMCLVLRQAATIVVPSDRLVDMFSFEPRLHSRVAVVPNAAPLFEPPMTARAPMRHEIRLVYLSNFIAAKGYAEVIRAVGILRHVHDLPVTCRLWESFSAMALRSAEPGRRSGALREDEPRRGRASQ